MLAIRMQRTGRKGHAMFRLVVQDARRTPTSGKVVAYLGHYDPHAKSVTLVKDKAQFYLDHGAQPSERVLRLLKNEGLTLPAWVQVTAGRSGEVRHPEKLRRNQPKEEAASPEVTADTATENTEAPAEAETSQASGEVEA